MMQRPNLPNPEELFRDPTYNNNAPKVSSEDMKAFANRYTSMLQPQYPTQNGQKFDDINNAKTFQIQSLHNDILAVKAKVAELEKRLTVLLSPPSSQQTPIGTIQQGNQGIQHSYQQPQNYQQPQQPQQGIQHSYQQPQQGQQGNQQRMSQQQSNQSGYQGFQPYRKTTN
jgi:hypothetical protein